MQFQLTWDAPDQRLYEDGIDRGVFCLPAVGAVVPWNGLISVDHTADSTLESMNFDGVNYANLQSQSPFQGTLRAFTYPELFEHCEGWGLTDESIISMDNQAPQPFHLAYRTLIGNPNDDTFGYRLHFLYNLRALPDALTHNTHGSAIDPTEFSWRLTSVPEEIMGYQPTAYVYFDSTECDPTVLAGVEEMLYGTYEMDPAFPTLSNLRAMDEIGFDPWRFVPDRGREVKALIEAQKFGDSMLTDIVTIGDSTTEGYGSTSIGTRWENVFADLLAEYACTTIKGEGYVPAYYEDPTKTDRFTGGTYTLSGGLFGLGLRVLRLTDGISTFQFTGTGADVIFSVGTGGGTFQWRIDGGAWSATQGTYSADTGGGWVFVSPRGLTSGPHTLEIQRLTSTIYIEGAMVYDGDEDSGIRLIESAHSNYQAYSFGGFNTFWVGSITPRSVPFATPPGVTSRVQPKLVYIMLGLNDYGTTSAVRRSPTQYKDDLLIIINAIKSQMTDTDSPYEIILMIPWERTVIGATLGDWQDYRKSVFAAARLGECGLVDLKQDIGSFVEGDPDDLTFDGVHLNDAGYSRVANVVYKSLLAP